MALFHHITHDIRRSFNANDRSALQAQRRSCPCYRHGPVPGVRPVPPSPNGRSRFTGSPLFRRPRLVRLRVSGLKSTEKELESNPVTVRQAPLMATLPPSTRPLRTREAPTTSLSDRKVIVSPTSDTIPVNTFYFTTYPLTIKSSPSRSTFICFNLAQLASRLNPWPATAGRLRRR
jgi:hypothetical protein